MKPADEVGFDVVKSGGRPFDVVMAAEIAKAITQARKEGAGSVYYDDQFSGGGMRKTVDELRREGAESMRERATTECERLRDEFGTREYAVGQPASSFAERFASGECADAIRSIPLSDEQ